MPVGSPAPSAAGLLPPVSRASTIRTGFHFLFFIVVKGGGGGGQTSGFFLGFGSFKGSTVGIGFIRGGGRRRVRAFEGVGVGVRVSGGVRLRA